MKVVVDASVAVKWYVPEVRDDLALVWLASDIEFSAPQLLLIETANVLSNKVREGRIGRKHLEGAMASMRSGRISIIPDIEILDRAVALSVTLQHAVYDCLYLALAEEMDAPLVTDDARFRSKASGAGFGRLIADFESGPPRVGRG